jgi:AraC-like DNA-binding protein
MYRGKSMSEWARELGISRERVRQLTNAGLLADRIKAGSSESAWERQKEKHLLRAAKAAKRIEKIVARLYSPRKTMSEIADESGLSYVTVKRALRRLGLKSPQLSRKLLCRVRLVYAPDKTIGQISREAGGSRVGVKNVLDTLEMPYRTSKGGRPRKATIKG